MAKKHVDDSVNHFFGGTGTDSADEADSLNFSLEQAPAVADESDAIEGEIAVDVYQTDTHVVIVSPIAGIEPENIEISATDDTLTISGERAAGYEHRGDHVFTQEIYWGAFSRTVDLPVPCLVDKAAASFKHGVLTIKVPKSAKVKKRTIKVKSND